MKKLALAILLFSGALWALQMEIDLRNPSDSTAISGEWELLKFLYSDENINKRNEYENCWINDDCEAQQCNKILDTWRESCAHGEEKYCIGVLAIHSKSDYGSYFVFDSLGAVERNCDKGMANSCHAVGEFYYDIYTESPNDKEASYRLESALLYLQKSCDLGMAVSCSFVAQMYKYGHFQEGTTEEVKIYADADKAREIATRDCKAGIKIACDFKEILAQKKSVLVLLLHW